MERIYDMSIEGHPFITRFKTQHHQKSYQAY